MGMDIRLPIGLMFVIMGVLLAGFGLFSDASLYTRSLGINVNTIWGTVLVVFGAAMLVLQRLRRRPARPGAAADRAEKP
ncbi:MAG: hypothetical protein WCK76_04845 [Elusimicrobiota bacterium]